MTQYFTIDDILQSIKECNFSKAIGKDGFDGTILQSNDELKQKIATQLTDILNNGQIPDYFIEGKLIPLSKKKSTDTVELGDIRPIVVRSHLCKIVEKSILNKIYANHLHLIKTRKYHTGYQKYKSTHINLINLIEKLKNQYRSPTTRRPQLFIDIVSAYNSISRSKLEESLLKRCQSLEDQHLVKIIMKLHARQKIILGEYTYEPEAGVAQGSILSPILFNLVLEDALLSSPILAHLINRNYLMAYAEDIVIQANSLSEIKTIVREFDKLAEQWGLKINISKCEILGPMNTIYEEDNIEGIKIVSKVKYLGMTLTPCTKEISSNAKMSIKRNLFAFKGRLRCQTLEVKGALLSSYCRSLLIYFATPLVASQIWSKQEVESIEKKLFRELHLLPRDVNRQAILNITQQQQPIWETIKALSNKVLKQKRTQQTFDDFNKFITTQRSAQLKKPKQNRPKLYIPRVIANTIWAATREGTCTNYKQHHFCTRHQCQADVEQLQTCDLIQCPIPIGEFVSKIKVENIRDWPAEQILQALIGFRLLHDSIQALESSGLLVKVKQEWLRKEQQIEKQQLLSEESAPLSSTREDTVMQEPDGQTQFVVRKRGRPKKIRPQDRTQMKITQFISHQ